MPFGFGAEHNPYFTVGGTLPNDRRPLAVSLYEHSFNTDTEFPKDRPFCVWDMGCGNGTQAAMLTRNYPHIRLLGIDKNLYPNSSSSIPIVHERIEEIQAISARALQYGAFPPDILTARNSLYYFLEGAVNIDRLFDGLKTLFDGNAGMKVLIYEDMQFKTYPLYRQLCEDRGLQAQERPPDHTSSSKYLRIFM